MEDRSYCDSPLTVEEVCTSISALKANKSPGTDGLTAEFYKSFSNLLAPFLLQVFTESIENNTLPPTLTQGLITLIPKPNKDLLFIDNWRPISLLNNDCKIMALILANRIKEVLDTIIDETQSGFMRNRHISNNIRLVLDLLDYSDWYLTIASFSSWIFIRLLIQLNINLFSTLWKSLALENFSVKLSKPYTQMAIVLLK